MPAPLGQTSAEPALQDPPRSDRALSGYQVATPDTTAAFEPVVRTAEPVTQQEDTPAAQASSMQSDDTNVGLAATPTHMLLLLGGALAMAGILVHITFRAVAARRRRVLVDRREVVWNSAYDQPVPNLSAPIDEAYAHDDVEKTLREILRACGHRAA